MAKQTLAIIDYNSGDMHSVAKAFEQVDKDLKVIVTNNPKDIGKADRIVLPGQGAFRHCMESLSAIDDMIETLNDAVLKKATPFLGLSVGMQLLATRGYEQGVTAGLNWIEGSVVPLQPADKSLKIPHTGWNTLYSFSANETQDNKHIVLRNIDSSESFYFVHSFVFECTYNHHCLALTDYGGLIPAIVGRDNIIGVQFHPEKSHEAGLKLLSNFLDWKP